MSTFRRCSRCGKDLTDAASLECGVGPVCRGIDNEVLAHVFPVDTAGVASASKEILVRLGRCAPETVATLTEVATSYFAGIESGTDNRKTVKRLDWACSFAHADMGVRPACIALMKALGYVGLATIIEGKASTSAAEVSAVDGFITVKAVKNHAAAVAFKSVPGWKFDGATKTWRFPWTKGDLVAARLATFYPATKLDMAAVVETAKAQASTGAASVFAALPTTVKTVFLGCEIEVEAAVTVTVDNGKLRVKTPYVGGFVTELKSLPWGDRKWSLPEAPKAWTVDAKHAKFVADLLAKYFPVKAAA